MIRYPELIVNGHTHSGKTASVLEAAIQHKERTGDETIFVNDEEGAHYIAQRILKRGGIDPQNLTEEDKPRAEEMLRKGPHLVGPLQLAKLLAKLNPSGEAGTKIAIFLDAPGLCSLEMNNSAGINGTRYRAGVSIQDPLAALVKNYSVHAASIQNYAMPSFN
jgi:hypothetical protein